MEIRRTNRAGQCCQGGPGLGLKTPGGLRGQKWHPEMLSGQWGRVRGGHFGLCSVQWLGATHEYPMGLTPAYFLFLFFFFLFFFVQHGGKGMEERGFVSHDKRDLTD